MGIELSDYQSKAEKAIRSFWRKREEARRKQKKSGKVDQGERSGVTAGKNMNGFLSLMKDIIIQNGLKSEDICIQRRVLTLPGYFRPTKIWDLLVINGGELIAAIEMKSQVGPSFGNNFNNRTEEAIGSALDLWTAYREGAFGKTPRPFVGWFMLLEDCDNSRCPVRDSSVQFPVFPEFDGASYAERYDILCQKLVQEQLYTTASVILSPRAAIKTGEYREMSDMTSFSTFITTLAGHIAAVSARK
jgi:hypothetical protein